MYMEMQCARPGETSPWGQNILFTIARQGVANCARACNDATIIMANNEIHIEISIRSVSVLKFKEFNLLPCSVDTSRRRGK